MELADIQLRNKEDDYEEMKIVLVSESTTMEKGPSTRTASLEDNQDIDPSTECSKAASNKEPPDNQVVDERSVCNEQQSSSACPSKADHNKATGSGSAPVKDAKTIPGPVSMPQVPETATPCISVRKYVVVNESLFQGEDEEQPKESQNHVGRSSLMEAPPSITQTAHTLTQSDQSNKVNCPEKRLPQSARLNDNMEEVIKHCNAETSKPTPLSSHSEGSDLAGEENLKVSLPKEGHVLPDSSPDLNAKSTDVYFLSHLGLKKISRLQNPAGVKANIPETDESSGRGPSDKEIEQQAGTESADKDCSEWGNMSSLVKPVFSDQPVKIVMEVGSKKSVIKNLKLVRPFSDVSCMAEGDSATRNKEGQMVLISSSNQTDASKAMPLYIKIKLQEKDVTVICCPVALLLQHKERVDVCLRANGENELSITCRLCSHEVSDPYAMLQHLKAEHQILGCLQRLLNINTRHFGCMIRPTCVNVPGVLTLPEGLSDMEQGVIRFSSLGIPRLSFMCRLCPLNFHTARGLNAHHHYYSMKSNNKDHPNMLNANWTCKLCPLQFPNFLDYYTHHKWMRIAKDLFVNTDPVIKKKRYEVMNEFGKVVASVEVPGTHSVAMTPGLPDNSDTIDLGWGRKGLQAIKEFTHPKLSTTDTPGQSTEPKQSTDSQIPSTVTSKTTHPLISKQQIEADKDKTTPLFQTLDSLCRRMVQKGEIPLASLDKSNLAGDNQHAEDHEYMCARCHKTFPRLAQMQGHMGSHLRKHRSPKYPVPGPTMVPAAPSEPPPVVDKPAGVEPNEVGYKCGVCSETFPKLGQMQTHMESHNRLHPATKSHMKSLDTAFSETVKLMSLTCDICHWSFPSERKLWAHRNTHTKAIEGEAGSSNAGSASADILKKKVFLCIICKKTFAREVNLRFHLKRHTAESRYSEVDLNFSWAVSDPDPNKPEHGVIQDGTESVQQHMCETCGRLFDTSKQLRSHLAWHNKVGRETESSQVTPRPDNGTSHSPNTCNKSDSPVRELRLHKRKCAKPQKSLVRRLLNESHRVKKRTLEHRGCNKWKNKVSNKDESGSNMRRKTKGRQRQRSCKFYCRICNRYFGRSNQFVNHMGLHTCLDRGKGRRSLSKSPRRGRYFQTKKSPKHKQNDGMPSSPSEICDDLKTPQHASETIVKATNKTGSEAAVNSPGGSSAVMVGDMTKDESSPEGRSQGSDQLKSDVRDKVTGKPEVELSTHSQTVVMGDTSQAARPAVPEPTPSGNSAVRTLDIVTATSPAILDHEYATMEVPSQETGSNSSRAQSPEASKDLPQMKEEPPQSKEYDLSLCLTVADNSSGGMVSVTQETKPATADAGPLENPILEGHQKNDLDLVQGCSLAEQSTVSGQVSNPIQETGLSATGLQSSISPSREKDDLQARDVPRGEDLDDELPIYLTIEEGTGTIMMDTSQKMQRLVPDVITLMTSEALQQTRDEATKKQAMQATAPVRGGGNLQAKMTCGVQFSEIEEAHSLTSVSSQKALLVALTPYFADDGDSIIVIKDTSQEAGSSSSSLDASKMIEEQPQPQPSDKSTAPHKDLNQLNAPENTSQDTRPSSSIVLTSDSNQLQSQRSDELAHKPNSDLKDHFSVCNGISTEIDKANSCSNKIISSQKVSDCNSSATAMQAACNGTVLSDVRCLETDDTQTRKVLMQKQKDSESTTFSTDGDDSNAPMPNTSKETSSSSTSQGTRSSSLPIEDKIMNSRVHLNSENGVESSEALEDKSEMNNSVPETDVDGEEAGRLSGDKERVITSTVNKMNSKGSALYSNVGNHSESAMMSGSPGTRPSGPTGPSEGNLLNNIGLSQIIEKLRQKLGGKQIAQFTDPDSSSTMAEDTSSEARATSSEARTLCSDDDSSLEDLLSKHSSNVEVVGAVQEKRPRVLETVKNPIDEAVGANLNPPKNEVEEKMFKCSECERCFSNINQLNAHRRVHVCTYAQKAEQEPLGRCASLRCVGEKFYRCEICSKTFRDYKKLCGHLGAHASHKMTKFKRKDEVSPVKSSGESCEEPENSEAKSVSYSARRSREYSCKFCDKSFHRLVQFRSHVMAVHPLAKGKLFLRPFICELCGKSFTKSRQRQIHMRRHARTRRRRRLKRKAALQLQDSDHTYFKKPPPHSQVKVYNCQLCEKSFPDQKKLAEHMDKHKRYSCRFCTASFTVPRQLCGHLKVHGGLKGGPSLMEQNQNDSSNLSAVKQAQVASRPVTRLTASSQSRKLLERVIKMYLFGVKPKKKRLGKGKTDWAKWLKPKHSLQRALVKGKQARMQKIYAVLRKSIILEIDADTHRLVYECKECKRCSLSHRAVLGHYLEEHLLDIEENNETPPSASCSDNKEDKNEAAPQRFRNKSKIGCPICKGSAGFQCHLHNEDGLMDIDSLLETTNDSDLFVCKKCGEGFPTQNSLVQHHQNHARRQSDGPPFTCTLCPFQSQSLHGLSSHQKAHKEKVESNAAEVAPARKTHKALSCPLCPFKVKNIYALAAHSRIHKGGRGKKRPHANVEAPSPSPKASPPPPPPAAEGTPSLPDGVKHRKNSYSCPNCPRYFYTMSAYHKHAKEHEETLRFKCTLCIHAFQSVQELQTHIASAHIAQKWYRCTECSFSSFNLQALQSHVASHPQVDAKKDSQAKWLNYMYVKHSSGKQKQGTGDSKANWSAYLSEVIRSRVAVGETSGPDQSSVELNSTSTSLSSQDGEAPSPDQSEGSGSDSKQDMNPVSPSPKKAKISKSEDVILKEGATKQFSVGETQRPGENGSLQGQSDSPDEYFACSQCIDFQASSKEEWDSHMAQVHRGSPGYKYKCSMCQYTTSKEERLTQHKRLHNVQTLQCNTCPYRTPQNHLMIRHIQTVHKQHRPFKCKQCTYRTSYRHHLRRHSEKHKNPNFRCRYRKLMKKGDWHSAEATSSRVTCNDCGRELLNKKTLRNHYIKVHGRPPGTKSSSSTQRTSETPEPKQAKGKQTSFSILPQDSDTASDENSHECSVCSLKFKRRSDLNRHMSQGHAETKASLPCQCPQCGLVTGSGQLQAHMEIHQEENLLVCEEEGCEFKTVESVHLQRHQSKHAAEKDALNTCRFCQIKFADASGLRLHNLHKHSEWTHSINSKAPYMCSQCPFISTNEKDACRHFSLHNYNLPFKCEYCIFSSSTASAIATHQKIHRYPRRNAASTLVSKKAWQRQKMGTGASVKSAANQVSADPSNAIPGRAYPKHVFVNNKGKKLYECRYCQRFFDVAETWQRHELRHTAEWPQY